MTRIALSVCLCALVLFSACAIEETNSPNEQRILALLAQGKAELARNEWGTARTTFEAILEKYDSTNTEARFGAALADTLFLADAIRYVVTIGERAAGDFLPSEAADGESLYINELIGQAILDVRARFAAAAAQLAIVEKDSRFVFRIDTLPLHLTADSKADFDLAGEWDRADALLLHGIVNALLATLEAAASIDLFFDFERAHTYISNFDFGSGSYKNLISLITYLLNDKANPNFLGLRPDGPEKLTQATRLLASAGHKIESAFYAASLETDKQDDDILRFIDENGDGRFVPAPAPNSDACATAAALQTGEAKNDFTDSFAFFDIRFRSKTKQALLNQRLFCLLQKLQVNFGWGQPELFPTALAKAYSARPRLNVIGDFLPLLDVVAAGISAKYPEITLGIAVPEGILTSLVGEVLGDSLELDPYAFFVPDEATGKPASVRGLLPVWETFPCPVTGICQNDFVIELECSPLPASGATFPTRFAAAFPQLGADLPYCKGAWVDAGQVKDTSHFDGAVASDGIIGYLPYIQFRDATFHGVLYLNLGATAPIYANSDAGQNAAIAASLTSFDTDPKEFTAATLTELNALLAALSANTAVSSLLLDIADEW